MKKRFLTFIALLMLFAAIPLNASASGQYVHDDANLMSEAQVTALEKLADELSYECGMDIVVLTVDTIGTYAPMAYADDFYDLNGYGTDGMILMVAMEERDWYISTYGKAINVFSDRSIDALLDAALPCFSDGLYYEGFTTVLSAIPSYTNAYKQGGTIRTPGRGFGNILLTSALIGAVVAGVALLIMRSSMNTKRKQRSAGDYMKQGTYRLRLHQDMFLYSQVTKTPRQQNNPPGGGSAHRSSGGRSHGGGGRKF